MRRETFVEDDNAPSALIRYSSAIAVVYFTIAAVINIGYISEIGFWSSSLFSITDLFQVNIAILRVLIAYAFVVNLFVFVCLPWLRKIWPSRIFGKDNIEDIFLNHSYIVMSFVVSISGISILTSSYAISAGLQFATLATLIFLFIIGYEFHIFKKHGLRFSIGYIVGLFTALILHFDSFGVRWAKADREDISNIVSIIEVDGKCVSRILARSVAQGYIVFNKFSNKYEFRRFDSVVSITPGQNCI
jgi:hypothetical protein